MLDLIETLLKLSAEHSLGGLMIALTGTLNLAVLGLIYLGPARVWLTRRAPEMSDKIQLIEREQDHICTRLDSVVQEINQLDTRVHEGFNRLQDQIIEALRARK